ncbi:MAG: hypothetical protein AAF681_12265, partial [Pseudomonadota bacterium]
GAALSNEDRLLLANALVSYADTLNLAAGGLDTQLAHYTEASEILTDLIASDLNRKDWKTLRSLALYREAGIYARQAMADGLPTLLSFSEKKFTEGINLLMVLVQRFDDDVGLARSLSAFYENRAEVNVLLLKHTGDENLKPKVLSDLDALLRSRLELFEKMQDEDKRAEFSRDLAQAYLVRARLGIEIGKDPETLKTELSNARRLFETLKTDPNFYPHILRDFAVTHLEEAKLWYGLGETDKACIHARSANDQMKSLVAESNENTKFKNESEFTGQQMLAYCDLEE